MSRYVPLSLEKFTGLRWTRFTDYRHAVNMHMVPVTLPETGPAAACLVTVFARHQDSIGFYALTGLEPNVSLCIDANNKWMPSYTPAMLRTHPFVLSSPSNARAGQMALCADIESPWVGKNAQLEFHTPEGGLAPEVAPVFEFLKDMEKHRRAMQHALSAIAESGILVPWDAGEIPGLYRVDERKLGSLENESFLTLRKNGALAIVYAQMFSTNHLPWLKQRHKQMQGKKIDWSLEEDDIFRFT